MVVCRTPSTRVLLTCAPLCCQSAYNLLCSTKVSRCQAITKLAHPTEGVLHTHRVRELPRAMRMTVSIDS